MTSLVSNNDTRRRGFLPEEGCLVIVELRYQDPTHRAKIRKCFGYVTRVQLKPRQSGVQDLPFAHELEMVTHQRRRQDMNQVLEMEILVKNIAEMPLEVKKPMFLK